MAELRGRIFYRYVGSGEVRAIGATAMLRGGRGAGEEETYWTEDFYDDGVEARARLSLLRRPEARVKFRITNEPRLELEGAEVEPANAQPGGGREWMSFDAVAVEVVSVDYFV